MRRRDLVTAAASTALVGTGTATARPAATAPWPPVRMKLGTQHSDRDDVLKAMAAFGVNHLCGSLPSRTLDPNWSVDALKRRRERIESYGLTLAMLPLPLSSSSIEKAENPNIMLGRSPERDREIDGICQMIRNAAAAGIPSLKYNLTILGVVRSEPTEGRGKARYSTFVYDRTPQEPPLTGAGRVTGDMMWERITYFLNRVVPVANEFRVRLACHPHDPGMPPSGFRGVDRVLGTVDGLKRFVQIQESPYHGLNFCQGTVSEMLENPATGIFDVIRWFGSRKKIFNVHFRNIRGKRLHFQETFPDNGDVDFLRALRVYREVGYDGMLMPDHVPKIEGDEGGRQAFAYCFGYIQALLQILKGEAG